ncbi:MAG: GNAT family N-acetyltransferase [Anaerolineaceae bacterium]|nr:MAG: GNAT family N-acetyltransferase [Anaerolineaceae bacterium]
MDDLETLHRVLNESSGVDATLEVRERWLQWTVLGYEMFAMLKQPHYGERGITLKNTGELIGAVGIVPYIDSFGQITAFNSNPDGPSTAEVGLYWAVAPAHQRQGYATEAARAIVNYLFSYLKLGRIIATTGYNNLASQAVMRKIGMTIEHAKKPQPPDIFVVGVLDNQSSWKF